MKPTLITYLVSGILLFVLAGILFTKSASADICDSGCIPLMDMKQGQTYYGEDGGLYGNYSNTPPTTHAQKLNEAKAQITPRDSDGNVSFNGKVVLLTLGMSNARMKSDAFIRQTQVDPNTSSNLVIVNGARGSVFAYKWAAGENWDYVNNMLNNAGVTGAQVQAVWMEHANGGGQGECSKCMAANGEYVAELTDNLKTISKEVKNRFPNVKLIFMSNRTYGGYATVDLNDEPYAYENGIAVRRTILDQVSGTQSGSTNDLTYVNAPVLTWGPNLWADDGKANSEGLAWFPDDFSSSDGTHPVENVAGKGAEKAAARILQFFKTDIYTASWFTQSSYPTPTNTPTQLTPTPTRTATNTPTPSNVLGDINGDGIVNIIDFTLLSNAFGTNDTTADINSDGIVNVLDFTILSNNFGKTG